MKRTRAQDRCLLALMKHGPMTKAELADKAFVALSTLNKCVTLEPMEEAGIVHRCLVLRKGGSKQFVWATGKEGSVSERKMEALKKRYVKQYNSN